MIDVEERRDDIDYLALELEIVITAATLPRIRLQYGSDSQILSSFNFQRASHDNLVMCQ